MRKAKIVCTIGPVTSSRKAIESLIANGMDVARLNFSYGDYRFHEEAIGKIRDISQKLGKHVAILQDLQGIKIRVGNLKNGRAHLVKGETLHIRTGNGTGDEKEIYIDYPWLMKDAHAGDVILNRRRIDNASGDCKKERTINDNCPGRRDLKGTKRR